MTLSGSGITRKQFVEMCMMACNSSEDVYHCFSYSFNQRETPFCRNCVIRSRRSRSAAAYSCPTFPWTICRSVCRSVCPCSALWKTADRIRMPFGIISRTGPGMRQIVGLGIGPWRGVLLGANLGCAIVTKGAFTAYMLQRRDAALFPNYFGQTCYCFVLRVHGTQCMLVAGAESQSPGLTMKDYDWRMLRRWRRTW